MAKLEPLPYAATKQARKDTALAIVALCAGSSAIAMIGVCGLVAYGVVPKPIASIMPTLVLTSMAVGIFAIGNSVIAFLRCRSFTAVLSIIVAVIYWATLFAIAHHDL
ncbi:MAG TPA: hypothetical protein VG269_17120 [Tepidisphaeraceae bacterium]|jgi:hypothetical protein|nr:hypothetical protein [Tepidisphaeraceae bacterium]